MDRKPEPELMDETEQAEAYADTDFSEPHDAFVAHFTSRFPEHSPSRVLDLGCGAADVTIRFARAYPRAEVLGVDGAAAMLACGQRAVSDGGLQQRITLRKCLLPTFELASGAFDAVISNSLLHHLRDPGVLWSTAATCCRPGGAVFVVDLARPRSEAEALQLMRRYAGGAPELLQRDYFNSLLAAYRPDEVRDQLAQLGLCDLAVEVVSDRHLIVWGRLWPAGEKASAPSAKFTGAVP